MESKSRKTEFTGYQDTPTGTEPEIRNRIWTVHNADKGAKKIQSRGSSKNVNPIISQTTSYRGGSFGETNTAVNEPKSSTKKNSLFSTQSNIVSPGINKFGSLSGISKQSILL